MTDERAGSWRSRQYGMGSPELILLIAAEAFLFALGVGVLRLSLHREPRSTKIYARWSARMHRRPWLFYWTPVALFAWGALDGLWELATSDEAVEAALRLVFPFMSIVALVLTVRVWRLGSANAGAENPASEF